MCAHHKIPRSDWSLDGKYNVIRFKNGSTIDLKRTRAARQASMGDFLGDSSGDFLGRFLAVAR